jgi:hypothetical protein
MRNVHEADVWPVADNSGSGTKDALADGLHPVVAIGGRTAADGRPMNLTGAVVTYHAGLTTPTGIAVINIADGFCVKAYVDNTLTYAAGVPATFEQAPVIGQPVYVDDSNDLGEGTTLSLSPLNDADVANPVAGHLFYCQDEYADISVGRPNSSADWPQTWANEQTETLVCVLLSNGWRDLAQSEKE